jgi:hypothetical protein
MVAAVFKPSALAYCRIADYIVCVHDYVFALGNHRWHAPSAKVRAWPQGLHLGLLPAHAIPLFFSIVPSYVTHQQQQRQLPCLLICPWLRAQEPRSWPACRSNCWPARCYELPGPGRVSLVMCAPSGTNGSIARDKVQQASAPILPFPPARPQPPRLCTRGREQRDCSRTGRALIAAPTSRASGAWDPRDPPRTQSLQVSKGLQPLVVSVSFSHTTFHLAGCATRVAFGTCG